MKLTSCNVRVYLGAFLLNATICAVAWAQADAPAPMFSPPPAWNAAPEAPPGFAPAPLPAGQPPAAVGTAPGAAPDTGTADGSYFVPVQPSPGFDYFEEEDGAGGFDGGAGAGEGGSGGGHAVKDSFKMVDRPSKNVCKSWGNSLLGPTTFSDQNRCETELDKKVDQGYASIDDLNDKVELYKLKKVIKGDLKNRSDAKQYTMNFDSIRHTLSEASREGCTCQHKY